MNLPKHQHHSEGYAVVIHQLQNKNKNEKTFNAMKLLLLAHAKNASERLADLAHQQRLLGKKLILTKLMPPQREPHHVSDGYAWARDTKMSQITMAKR
jgi:hypothetical protein